MEILMTAILCFILLLIVIAPIPTSYSKEYTYEEQHKILRDEKEIDDILKELKRNDLSKQELEIIRMRLDGLEKSRKNRK